MNPIELTLTITLYANAVASQLTDQEIELYASIFSQLGDTLNTIVTQKSCLEKKKESQ